MPMDPLFPEFDRTSAEEAARRRDEAMGRAQDNAPVSARAYAEQALRYVAERRPWLTTDPVERMLQHWGVKMPREKRFFGPLMKAAVGWGWIEPTERTTKSVLPSNHRRPKAVWKSRLYDV